MMDRTQPMFRESYTACTSMTIGGNTPCRNQEDVYRDQTLSIPTYRKTQQVSRGQRASGLYLALPGTQRRLLTRRVLNTASDIHV